MIYVSTGGFPELNFFDACSLLSKAGLRNFELSSGKYTDGIEDKLKRLSRDYNIALHNYFPVPEKPFVFNLASNNDDIIEKSIEHAKRAIDLSAMSGAKFYSFHAGFLFDPDPSMLGQKLQFSQPIAKHEGIANFTSRVKEVNDYAKKRGITLLVENNVLSNSNRDLIDKNPLLCSCPESTEEVFKLLPDSVGLLLDVAHLKVSANTIGYSAFDYAKEFKEITRGYHLSDNNGLEDSNEKISRDSWFWDILDNSVNYVSVEVYVNDATTLAKQYNLVDEFF